MKYFSSVLLVVLAIGLTHCDSGPPPVVQVEPPPLYVPPSGQLPGEWEKIGNYVFTIDPALDKDGNIYFTSIFQDRIYKLAPDDVLTVFDEKTARTFGLMFAADGRLIGCRNFDAQIVAYDMQGGREVLLQGELTPDPESEGKNKKMEFCNGLVVSSSGHIWFNDRLNKQTIHLNPEGKARVVASGHRPNGIILSPDEKILVTTDSYAPKLWAYDVLPDGSLKEKPDFFEPLLMGNFPREKPNLYGRPGTDGMTVDGEGRYYVTSFIGIQVYSADGKHLGVIKLPGGAFLSGVTLGSEESGYLYATGRQGLYRMPLDYKSGQLSESSDASD
ncbi:MAG: SMP-30/gluconolactonase/LRE family protein [Gammaproteobacteria bacterium]|nr:SMP-30/gluconolactonase/LRE family protein [Gammaproteobacteria bacterium]MCP4927568.1 SMP-30/gluconolactonase/LRE family protein [Gammaproteobacteria bacterium]